jgi:hypothetical protein
MQKKRYGKGKNREVKLVRKNGRCLWSLYLSAFHRISSTAKEVLLNGEVISTIYPLSFLYVMHNKECKEVQH